MQRYILSWKFHNNSILLFVRNSETMSTYKRVLLKLSGESLGGPAGKGIDENWLAAYAEEVAQAVKNGLQVAIVIGGGNIFRAFQCNVAQNLLNEGILDTGIIAVEGFDYEIIEKMYRPHDNLTILATLKADNTVEKTIVASITESLILDSENDAEYTRLKEIFSAPSLKMASFTITEKGYAVTDPKGNTLPAIEADFSKGPEKPASYLGKVVSLLYHRYLHGKLPIAMVSMDNCSHNGDKVKTGVLAYVNKWVESGFVPGRCRNRFCRCMVQERSG